MCETLPWAFVVDGKDGEILRLEFVLVALVGDTPRTASNIRLVVRMECGRGLTRANIVASVRLDASSAVDASVRVLITKSQKKKKHTQGCVSNTKTRPYHK